MKALKFIVLALSLVTISACIIEPWPGGGEREWRGDHGGYEHDRR